jgi:hypothetical protein
MACLTKYYTPSSEHFRAKKPVPSNLLNLKTTMKETASVPHLTKEVILALTL